MPNYRRAFVCGGTFFFTVVTYGRERFLCEPLARRLLRQAVDACRVELPFEVAAWVLLPDHLHAVWRMPDGDCNFSKRWGVIKAQFTQKWLEAGGRQGVVSQSRENNWRRGVWQRRFWEHCIRDEDDLKRHVDYIHYNPVKHGLVRCAHSWPYSTFGRLAKEGWYQDGWMCSCDGKTTPEMEFTGLDVTAME